MKSDEPKRARIMQIYDELYNCRNHIVDFERYTGISGTTAQAYEYLTDALDSIQLVDTTWDENNAFARRIADQAEQLVHEYFLETTTFLIESFIKLEEGHTDHDVEQIDADGEDKSKLQAHYLEVARSSLEQGALFRYKRRSQAMISYMEAIWAIRRHREVFTV